MFTCNLIQASDFSGTLFSLQNIPMAPKRPPLPPGLISGSDRVAVPSSAPATKASPHPHWWKGRKGQKSLARAAQATWERQNAEAHLMVHCPWAGTAAIPEWESPLYDFRRRANKLRMSRLLLFFFQTVLEILRFWSCPPDQERQWGLGEGTVSRTAMLMHHTVTITHIHWRRMVSLERRLYARAFREGESLRLQQSAAGPAESDDWRADLENEVRFTLATAWPELEDDLMTWLPPVNPDSEKAHEQWPHEIWKAVCCLTVAVLLPACVCASV